ncbi:hypothetical protein [Frondihabitans sucicola]|uniref:hypothetical protein n=1 Tax=Frondihabitans sucicola TaxID=1268041 RepID=UPI002573BFE2|nr:hypothetical protein [Frondihabitans sucicola]
MSLLLTATRRLLVLRRRTTTSEGSLLKAIEKRGNPAPVSRGSSGSPTSTSAWSTDAA